MSKFQVLHSHNDSKILPVIANYIVYTNITLNIIWYKTIYNMKEVIKLLYTIQPIVIISKEVCRICCVNNLTCSMSAILALSSKMASSNFWILFSVTKWLSSTFLSTLSCNNKKEILCWMKCSWELFKKMTLLSPVPISSLLIKVHKIKVMGGSREEMVIILPHYFKSYPSTLHLQKERIPLKTPPPPPIIIFPQHCKIFIIILWTRVTRTKSLCGSTLSQKWQNVKEESGANIFPIMQDDSFLTMRLSLAAEILSMLDNNLVSIFSRSASELDWYIERVFFRSSIILRVRLSRVAICWPVSPSKCCSFILFSLAFLSWLFWTETN